MLAAVEQLPACMRLECPAFIRRDCATYKSEIDAAMPTFVVRARRSAGADVSAVRVVIDGRPFAESLDGLAHPLDPGQHVFRFETAGSPPVERTIVLREGEKIRAIEVVFVVPEEPTRAQPESPGIPTSAWVLGAIGVAALGGFAYLGATGLDDYHALERGCGKSGSCASGDVSSARTRLWVADGLLVAGTAALAAGAWIVIGGSRDSHGSRDWRARVGIVPSPSGVRAAFAAAF